MGNKDVFEQMARQYDRPERVAVARRIAEAVGQVLMGAEDKDAMDYGCGTGLVGLELVDQVGSMLFVDASAQMIACVEEKIERADIQNAGTLCADFLEEAPSDIRVDYILMSQVLLHVREYAALLQLLCGMLRPGGHLILVDFDKNERVQSDRVHNGFVQQDLRGELERMGFASVVSHTFYEGQSLFMNQDASLFIMDALRQS